MGLSQAERKADVIKKTGTACVMRDGCRLATDVYLPSEEGKWPAVLYRTPYGRNSLETDSLYSRFPELVADGYAVVTQDLRGTGESEGTLGLNGQNEFDDGYDAVEWLAQQPFCDGSVGMFGLSYPGFVQNAAASRRPPHLKAVCPFMCPSQQPFGIRKGHVRHMQHLFWAYAQTLAHPDNYIPDASRREDVLLQMRENFSRLEEMIAQKPPAECEAAQIPEVPILKDYLDVMDGAEDPEYWKKMHMPIDFDQVRVPALFGTGWLDGAREWTIDSYLAARRSRDPLTREHARLIIGIWPHGGDMPDTVEGTDYTPAASGRNAGVFESMHRWFDLWLKGKEEEEEPRVRYFVRGSNLWRTAEDWPPEGKTWKLYLHADGTLSEHSERQGGQVSYTVDPADPMPSAITDRAGRRMTADWQDLGERKDAALFVTSPLEKERTLAGTMKMHLYASADTPDTDYACRLFDIAPDGRRTELLAGLIRARHERRLFDPEMIAPGEVHEYCFDAGNAANMFAAGHRIGLQVMGQLYPDYDRNMNTGESTAHGMHMRTSRHTLYTGAEQASCLEMNLIGTEE